MRRKHALHGGHYAEAQFGWRAATIRPRGDVEGFFIGEDQLRAPEVFSCHQALTAG